MNNAEIARTLDAYAALLDLAGAAHWSVRAYRRAADLVRATPAPVEELVRNGRVRELRGIGPGIERRLRELVDTGRIAELEELEREVEPGLVALGRYLGIGPQRLVALGRALGIRSADELRAAAEAGRLREAPSSGPIPGLRPVLPHEWGRVGTSPVDGNELTLLNDLGDLQVFVDVAAQS